MELDSHTDTIVCGSNCIIINFTGKECEVVTYTDAYETIKVVSIVQEATAYDNPDTGETTILILNKAIWMGETMDHTLVKPNQLRAYGMIVKDNPFAEAPIFIATEDHDFMLTLSSKGTILGLTTRTTKDKELHMCPHVTCSLAHEWYPQNVSFSKSSHTMEEEISSNIGAGMMEVGYLELIDTDSDNDSVDQIYDIGTMKSQIIGSVKVASIPSRNVSDTKATVQDVPHANTL